MQANKPISSMNFNLQGLQEALGRKVIERITTIETNAESMDEFWQTIFSLRTTPIWQILDLESVDPEYPDTALTLSEFFNKYPVTPNSNQPLPYIAIFLMYSPITPKLRNSYITPENIRRQLLALAPNLNSLSGALNQKEGEKLLHGFRNRSYSKAPNMLLVQINSEYKNPDNKEVLRFKKFHFSNGLFTGYAFENTNVYDLSFAYSVFPEANLQNSSFELCDFTGANFYGATLSTVNFDKCTLRAAKFAGATFNGIVSFAGCDLTGADFTGIDLEKIDLNGAWNISRANFTTSILEDEEKIQKLIADEEKRRRKLKKNHFINMTMLILAGIPTFTIGVTAITSPFIIFAMYLMEGAAALLAPNLAAGAVPVLVLSPAVALPIVIALAIILVIGGILCVIYGLKANKTSFELSLTGEDVDTQNIASHVTANSASITSIRCICISISSTYSCHNFLPRITTWCL
jgi:hypothetical protein